MSHRQPRGTVYGTLLNFRYESRLKLAACYRMLAMLGLPHNFNPNHGGGQAVFEVLVGQMDKQETGWRA